MKKLIIKNVKRLFVRFITMGSAIKLIILIQKFCSAADPKQSLTFLLNLEKQLYSFTGSESCRYNNGIHTKHKHTGYHNFFIKNIKPGQTVLDIGCGNGTLAYDIAKNVTDIKIYGIDLSTGNIEYAKKHYSHNNLEFVAGDALKDLPDQQFDCIILSNVLEHIENRVDFLQGIISKISPNRVLIRVPLYERDWRVPLMEELGIDYRLDSTHFIEYVYEDFEKELDSAGLMIDSSEFRWGEVWSVCSIKG